MPETALRTDADFEAFYKRHWQYVYRLCFSYLQNEADAEDAAEDIFVKTETVFKGPLELTGVNIYNARCQRGFITSTYFVMYRDGKEDRMLHDNFVIKMRDEKIIDTVYRWE